MRARKLVRIGVVHDDLSIAGERRRNATVADGTRQPHRAVFVGVFQPCIDDDRRLAAIELLFESFLGDSGNGHGQLLSSAGVEGVNFRMLPMLPMLSTGRYETARVNGSTRPAPGTRILITLEFSVRDAFDCRAFSARASSDQPGDRRPQCGQRRKIAPDSQETL